MVHENLSRIPLTNSLLTCLRSPKRKVAESEVTSFRKGFVGSGGT